VATDEVSDFRRALQHDELVVHYLPILDLHTLVVTGAEGLVRWEHPERGLLSPAEFLPEAEQTGLIRRLTSYVLGAALGQWRRWSDQGLDLTVSVNITTSELSDESFPEEVKNLLEGWKVEPSRLELEISGNTVMVDPLRGHSILSALSEQGVRLAVDNFGTGYSSLAQLKRLPVQILKIDKSFVMQMLNDHDDLNIVRSTIELGHDLGLTVVAPGAEDERTLMRLAMLGADLAQGYHVSKPLAPDAFAAWVVKPRYIR
jgi:EAL domain-containing protein (putative c-di-GMP-specific phosphodiesterase class I)